ncbi:CAP domain-containing protein [archaeon]
MVRKSVKKSGGRYVKPSVRKVGDEKEAPKASLDAIPIDKIKRGWEKQKREMKATAEKEARAKKLAEQKKAEAIKAAIKKKKEAPRPKRKRIRIPWKPIAEVVIAVILVLGLVLLFSGTAVPTAETCGDGTLYNECSVTQPYKCVDGQLVPSVDVCDCPDGQRGYNNECVPWVECSDGTFEPECSTDQPFQCVGGALVENAGVCGCPENTQASGDSCAEIITCVDGTEEGYCSTAPPYGCVGQELVPLASQCGCPEGEAAVGDLCVSEEEAALQAAFGYINSLRAQYGRNEIQWDARASELAVDRARDMFARGYTDHVTPEGTCAQDMQSQYGFSNKDIIVENILKVWYESGFPAPDVGPLFAVDEWMTSRAHRYNLLYEYHYAGGIGCYKNFCLFYGVHQTPGGFGSGGCSSWDDNKVFWDDASPQPGEVFP